MLGAGGDQLEAGLEGILCWLGHGWQGPRWLGSEGLVPDFWLLDCWTLAGSTLELWALSSGMAVLLNSDGHLLKWKINQNVVHR